MEILTKEKIRKICPVALLDAPSNENLSNRYVFMSTERVIDDMAKLNWFPIKATMRNKHKEDSMYSKHMITFRNPDMKIVGEDGEDSIPQIILTNSYDGYSSLRFYVGVFRLVCSNGLVIADKNFENIQIKHKGYSFETLREVLSDKVMDLPGKVEIMSDMINKKLTDNEIKDFALQSLMLRTGTPLNKIDTSEANYDDDILQMVLNTKRKQDEGNDLWRVLNRVQENLVNGGFKVLGKNDRFRKLSKIKSFDRDLEFNKNLFKLAAQSI